MSSNSERIHHRYCAEIPVTVRWRKESQNFRACDVSLGGLFILTETPPALRELLRLEFMLPPHDTKLTVHAMTVNVSHRNDPEGRPPGAGLQLYAMDREAQKIWSSYIDYVRKTVGTTPVKAIRPPLVPSAPIAPPAAPPVAAPVTAPMTPVAVPPAAPAPPPLPPAHTAPAAPPSATRPLPPSVLNVPQATSPLMRPAPVQSVLAPPVPSMIAPPFAPSMVAPPMPSMVAPPPAPSMLAPPMAPSMRSPGTPAIPAAPKVPAVPFTPTVSPKAPPPHASLTPSRVTAATPSGAPKVPFKPALHRTQGGFKPRAAGQTTASLTPHSPHTSKSTVVKVEIEPRSTETVFPVEDDGFVILR